jgi:peptide/nickel transport system substrate-binding protein
MTTRRAILAAAGTAPLLWSRAFADTPRDTLVMAKRIDDIISLDPQEAFEYSGSEITGNIYEKLVTPGADPTRIEPQLAQSWTASDDGRTWTFTLQPGRRFASGAPVTAEDAAFSLCRAVILNKAPGFIIGQFGFTPDNVRDRIRATAPQTLVIEIAERQAPTFLLYCLSAGVGGIVEKAVVLQHAQAGPGGDDLGNAWLKTNSAGSGPFTLRSARASELVTLDANPNHPQPALLKRVIIRHVADPAVQLLLLQKGDVDVARDLLPEGVRAARAAPDLTVLAAPKASLMFISMNTRTPALADARVREAIRWAIDYQAIQANLVAETFTVHQAFLPGGFPAALADTPFRFDRARTRALLAQAGFTDGLDLTLDHANSSPRAEIAQALQAQMAQAGIRLTLIAGEGRQVLTKMRARQHQLAISLWGSDYMDPHSNAQTFCVNEDNTDTSRNRTSAWINTWSDPDLTTRALAAVKQPDAARRVAEYEAMQRDLMQRGPFAIMLQETAIAAMRKPVTGLVTGPISDRTLYGTVRKG